MVANHNLKVYPTDRITNESAVIARMIMGTRARLAVIGGAGLQSGCMELVHLFGRFVLQLLVIMYVWKH